MEQVYALGSYSRTLGVYLMDERSQLLCILEGQKGGLTHLKFTHFILLFESITLYSGRAGPV